MVQLNYILGSQASFFSQKRVKFFQSDSQANSLSSILCAYSLLGGATRKITPKIGPKTKFTSRFCRDWVLNFEQGKKEYAQPPRDPSFLGLSPDPEVAEQTKL